MKDIIYRLKQENPFLYSATVVVARYLDEDNLCVQLEVYDATANDTNILAVYKTALTAQSPELEKVIDTFSTQLRLRGISAEIEDKTDRMLRPHKEAVEKAFMLFLGGKSFDVSMREANYRGERSLFLTYCSRNAPEYRLEAERDREKRTSRNLHMER